MDYSSARGHTVLDVQHPPERLPYFQQAEQPPPDCLPYHHHQGEQHGPHESCHIDYLDARRHLYKHQHHHHHHHHRHIQQQLLQHHDSHTLPAAGGYADLSGGFIASEASPVSCEILPHIEKEKQALPQNQFVAQCSSASVQTSYKPCEDGYVSVKTHEDGHFPPMTCDDAHILPGRRENLNFAHDGRYSQHQFHSSRSASALVVPRIRLLCSIGGRIMSRPLDGKLRYCGGDTHIITVERGICFSDFMGKLSRMYGSALTLKYQLPGEDLDALVSISSDDDLQNMLDEYDKMVVNGSSSWFRLFLFHSPSDYEIISHLDFSCGRENCCTQIMQRYINTINGFDCKGVSECLDGHLDNRLNDCQPSLRTPSSFPSSTLPFPCIAAKTFSRVSSAPSSVPSSPSVAGRLAHYKHCGTGDICLQISKDQHSFATPMNGLEVNIHELSQDRHVDTLKCDHHQSRISGESPKVQQDPSFSRGDAVWVKENGTYLVEPEDTRLHQCERHRGTGTILVDSWHDVSKPFGLVESRCEANCGNQAGAQPLTSPACHGGQVEDDFGIAEPVQHCYVEGHKQASLLHQLHQTGSPLHCEGFARLQQVPGIGSICQTTDGHGPLQFSQEPVHIHLQNANVTSSVPIKALGSTQPSPRNVYHGGCCCCLQHSQVDRGVSVSLGEHSHSKKPFYFGDRTIKRHGLPHLSRFCDGSNFCSDSAALHCLPTLAKGLDFDEEEHDAYLRKQSLHRINTCSHRVDCGAKENLAHSFMDPVHGVCDGSLHQCQSCFADFHVAKGQHLDKARVFSNPECQAYIGQYDAYPGNIEENLTAGRLTHDLKADPNLERGNECVMGSNYSNGQGNLETQIPSTLDDHDISGYVHMRASNCSSVFGHKESGCDLKSESFSSTDAVAGSLSRHSLEPPGWVDSPSLAVCNDQLQEREVHECTPPADPMSITRQLVDETVNHEDTGDTCRNPSFDCRDSYAMARSVSTSANAGELRVDNSSLTHVPEDKISIPYARSLHPNFEQGPCTVQTLNPDIFRGSATLALSIHDKSPTNSVNGATFSFAQSEQKSVSIGKDAPEQSLSNRSAFLTAPHQSYGQQQELAKTEVDAALHETAERETLPVLGESKVLSKHSSGGCSLELGVHDKGSAQMDTVPAAQPRLTDETVQEVDASGSVNCCTKEDEKELPATQAEAEAIARGLQIIKNDDLEDLKELGSGTYGTVFHGKWRGSDVAIKRIKASCFMGSPLEQERLISDFWREAGTLSQLHHPNIVAFYGVVPDGPGGTLATVTEYMVNGSLKHVLMKKDRTIDRRKRLLIAMDAAFGMEYLHSKRIVHFDLKSENLLVNMRDAHRPICKVGDFGLSKVKHQTLVSGGVRGTLPWMAPELLNTKGLVTEKVDVYSFGIVMWELLTGEEPYANMHCGTIIGGIVNSNLRPVIPSWCDPSWRDLMERCWSGNPADRPDFFTVASELRAIASSMNVK